MNKHFSASSVAAIAFLFGVLLFFIVQTIFSALLLWIFDTIVGTSFLSFGNAFLLGIALLILSGIFGSSTSTRL